MDVSKRLESQAGMARPRCRTGEITVLVASDVRIYVEGITAHLGAVDDISVVGTASTPEAAASQLVDLQPTITLLDMSMEGSESMVRSVMVGASRPGIIALGVRECSEAVLRCARLGMSGYVSRDSTLDDVVRTIRCISRGEFLCSPQIAASLFDRVRVLSASRPAPGLPPLTARQEEILALIERGMSNKEIARRLGITISTVKNHVHTVLEKLHVRKRGAAAAWLRRQRGKGRIEGPKRRESIREAAREN